MNARMFLCVDIRSNSTTPRRVALARMFKEAGLRSPRTQLIQIEMSVLGRHTQARPIKCAEVEVVDRVALRSWLAEQEVRVEPGSLPLRFQRLGISCFGARI